MIQYKLFERSSSVHYAAASGIWNAAASPEFTISPTFIGYNTQAFTGVTQEGRLAFDGRRPVGYALVSHAEGLPQVVSPETGFVELVAVHPDYQRREIGTQLMDWAEGWLRKRGVREIRLGGGLVSFAPGVPDELNAQGFFKLRGYQARAGNPYEWDVARSLVSGPPLEKPERSERASLRPARPSDLDSLHEFFAREFPGRWQYEFNEFIRLGGRISDVLLLIVDDQLQGFAWITLEDSLRSLERYHPARLPEPWAHMGPLGVGESLRGQGWGRFMMQSALQFLRMRSIRGVVIDWTSLLDFYEKFGFTPYRRYIILSKAGSG
jgi:GNAT superfamily N-acetyltransferase